MYKFKDEEMKLRVFNWCAKESLDDTAMQQLKNISSLPFAFHHIAAMPDCHGGYGMPIGAILATSDVIIPNAVGVDIGCGMFACKTSIKVDEINIDVIKKILGRIREIIPVGMKHNKDNIDLSHLGEVGELQIVSKEYKSACKQVGTLGGGNHFIELQKDEYGFLWFMLHSGSRNLGFKVAGHYNNVAKELNEKWHSKIPEKYDLAFLPEDSEEGQNYLYEMDYCLKFAKYNRELMAERIMEIITVENSITPEFKCIAIQHNYAAKESHFGRNVIVHRKGAVRARLGEIGIIAGSQGSCSYIVKGKGCEDSFQSCSHGAGRKMGRKQAINNLSFEDEVKHLNDAGIIHSIRNKADLDEATGAYKDIEIVIAAQSDLIDIVFKLTPIAVVKG